MTAIEIDLWIKMPLFDVCAFDDVIKMNLAIWLIIILRWLPFIAVIN